MIEILGVVAYFALWIFFNFTMLSATCAAMLLCTPRYVYGILAVIAALINSAFIMFIPITVSIK